MACNSVFLLALPVVVPFPGFSESSAVLVEGLSSIEPNDAGDELNGGQEVA
jgi:hypothetical protein